MLIVPGRIPPKRSRALSQMSGGCSGCRSRQWAQHWAKDLRQSHQHWSCQSSSQDHVEGPGARYPAEKLSCHEVCMSSILTEVCQKTALKFPDLWTLQQDLNTKLPFPSFL